jgi:hypothetical protein
VITKGGVPFLHNFGANNVFLGGSAGNFALTGSGSVAIGGSALNALTSGLRNTAIGFSALVGDTAGSNNVAIGAAAMLNNTTGSNNVALGRNVMLGVDGGTGNVAIGAGSGSGWGTPAGINNIAILSGGAASESNTIRIGDPTVHTAAFVGGISGSTVAGGVPVLVDANGHLGTVVSSSRYKQQIEDMGGESDVLMRLRPVAFYYRPELDDTQTRQYGLVAEEVAQVAPELVVYDKDGAPQSVRYHFVNAMLLGEVQKQRGTIDRQEREIQDLTDRLARLESLLAASTEK